MDAVKRSRSKIGRGGVELIVRAELFIDQGGNDRVRAEAYLFNKNGESQIAGVDILLYPPNPLMSVVPHNTAFMKKGVVLTATSLIMGAVGPMVGGCLGEGNEQDRFRVRGCVSAKIDEIVEAAFAVVFDYINGTDVLE